MSSWFLLVVLVFVAFIALAAIKIKQGGSGSVGFPYQPAKALFSAAERSFLGVLDQAVGSEHRVFGKVRVADVAMVKPGLGKSARQGALNRVAYKHFDFVVSGRRSGHSLCSGAKRQIALQSAGAIPRRLAAQGVSGHQPSAAHGSGQAGILATRDPLSVLGGRLSTANGCVGWHLTIHSSRRCFATRLNSSVRPQGRVCGAQRDRRRACPSQAPCHVSLRLCGT